MKQILSWCASMFRQNDGVIRVRTASCQNGALSALRHTDHATKLFYNRHCTTPISLEENIVFLNRKEALFIDQEVHRLLKSKLAETERKKKEGIPLPPAPGKITYAVYQ